MKVLYVVGGYPIGTHPFVLWQLRGAIDLGHQAAVLAANHGNAAGLEMAAQLKLPPELFTYVNARTYAVLNANPCRLLRPPHRPRCRQGALRPRTAVGTDRRELRLVDRHEQGCGLHAANRNWVSQAQLTVMPASSARR